MEPEQYARLREVFDGLMDLPADKRMAELDRLMPKGDPWRGEIEAWLAAANATRTAAGVTLTAVTKTNVTKPVVHQPLAPGILLGERYRLMRLLGAGGFSQAYLAEDQQLHGKQVVVKIPRPESNADGEEWFARHFFDEIRALAALNHSGIVQVLDSARDQVHGEFFTEQFIDGPALAQLIKKEPLGIERSAKLLEKIAQALAAAHAKGIIHRDLKPHNVQIRMAGSAEEAPVLIDFGIASLLGPEGTDTVNTRVAGTPDYLAPEQAMGKVLPQSDLYAFGCMAVELLTGERLNWRLVRSAAAVDARQIARDILAEKAAAIPPELRESIAKLMSLNPVERGTAAEQAELFRQLVPTTGTVTVQAPPAPLTSSRRGWLLAGGAGAAVAAAGLLWRTRDAGPPAPPLERLRLSVKAQRNNRAGTTAISIREGIVTQNDKLRIEVALSPKAYCYVFAHSLAASGGAANDLQLLYPPQPLSQAVDRLSVPSTAKDWIEFDSKPEILRLLFIVSLEALPEADRAIRSAASSGTVSDVKIRAALEARILQLPNAPWAEGPAEAWVAVSHHRALCAEGRLQHVAG